MTYLNNMLILFWVMVSVVLYTYIGYPVIVYLISRFYKQPVKGKYVYPTVSIIISVYNEEKNIENKIQSLLELDYPEERFEILIGSDGATDGTEGILRSHQDTRSPGHTLKKDCFGLRPRNDTEKLDFRLRGNDSEQKGDSPQKVGEEILRCAQDDKKGGNDIKIKAYFSAKRQGKPSMLNLLVKEAKGEIIVFTDARQRLAKSALKELVKNFSDKKVGSVSGELIFEDGILRYAQDDKRDGILRYAQDDKRDGILRCNQNDTERMDSRLRGNDKESIGNDTHKIASGSALAMTRDTVGSGMGLYWEYEKIIRESESKMGSMLGATGALYAIRRELFPELPKNLILDDMYIPMKIVQNGYRAIFDPKAEVYDRFSKNAKEEFLRKTRTLAGNFQLFAYMNWLFNPFKSPLAWQLISHKFLRLVVPFLLIGIFISNFYLLNEPLYRAILMLQIVFYTLAVLGWVSKRANKMFDIPKMFCVMNAAAVVGLIKFITNRQSVVWEK